jgi:hypothetical protein
VLSVRSRSLVTQCLTDTWLTGARALKSTNATQYLEPIARYASLEEALQAQGLELARTSLLSLGGYPTSFQAIRTG